MRWIVQTSLRYRYLVIFLAVVLMIFTEGTVVERRVANAISGFHRH